MSVLLDTAVLIAAERGTFDMPGYLAALGDAPVALAALTALVAGSEVATLNTAEFSRVSGLCLAELTPFVRG